MFNKTIPSDNGFSVVAAMEMRGRSAALTTLDYDKIWNVERAQLINLLVHSIFYIAPLWRFWVKCLAKENNKINIDLGFS